MYRNLEAELTRAGISEAEIVEKLGITRTTFSKKMNGKGDWNFKEITTMQEEINKKLDTHYTLDYLFEVRS